MSTPAPADILRLETYFAAAKRVSVAVHAHPDGDALGSGTALVTYLDKCRRVEARLLMPDPAPAPLEFLVDGERTLTDPQAAQAWIAASDLVVCLDMKGPRRAGFLEAPLRASGAPGILIDHHLDPDREAFDLVFSETEISSASELLYQLLLALPGVGSARRLPLEVLTPLMAGMTTDTNNFANSVFPSTLQMASELLDAGVDRDALIDRIFNSYRPNRFQAMGAYLGERLSVREDGVAWAVLDKAFLQRFDLQDGETEGFVNLPLGIAGVRLSVFLKEDEGHFRVSLRSKKGISANRLATEAFHGGGHEQAAGGKLYFPQDIATPGGAAAYVETVTARFMRNQAPSQCD